jgi:hypothetical protein
MGERGNCRTWRGLAAAAAALTLLVGGVAQNAVNTPSDAVGDAPDTADFIQPGFQADFKTVPDFPHARTGRFAVRPLSDPAFHWSPAYAHAKPARGLPPYVKPGLPFPAFSALHDELEVYPNEDAMAAAHYSPFSISDGALRITVAPLPAAMRPMVPDDYPAEYVSGAMNTYPFSQTYGYFEITARIPHGRALWPAFWLLPTDLDWPPEIDVMEVLGQDTTKLYTTIHSKKLNPGDGKYLGFATKGTDLSTGFHRYAVDWGPQKIRFYLDRKLVFSEPTPPDMHQPFYMLVNLGVGARHSWPGAPDGATHFPAYFDIAHISAWQRRAYAAAPGVYPPTTR